jgi:hypothetical protein
VGVVGAEGMTAAQIDERDRVTSWASAPKSETRVLFTCLMFLTRIPCVSTSHTLTPRRACRVPRGFPTVPC